MRVWSRDLDLPCAIFASRPGPCALFHVVHERIRYFNWFIVFEFVLIRCSGMDL